MKMKNPTLFEDLSNEVLYEIFDYLNAFDVFLTFTSLNERISTILKYIRLHIIVDSIIPNALSINKDDLPIVASLKKFDLQILTQFDIHSLSLILYCMPNLQDINFTFITEYLDLDTPYIDVLLNGNIWQQILISHVPYLNTFNIHISLLTNDGLFDLQSILDSFRCFLTQFDGWHMAISRLETFRYSIPFYRYFYTNESRQYINKLSSLIDLSSIVTLEFRDEHDLRQLHIVPYILLKLRFMIVEFVHNGLPDVPISRNYIIEKRRQSFGLNRNDEYKVNVMLGDDDLRIWIP
ncbi:unnamed protein product [Rotaria sordida]|uniref:F-box domain-containing protein n=1 Tax=Rotaria sordida TaxID=392033 RepID=A0A819FNB8_9BILA|nr:unnamed protein product [Rotaria sordida]